MFEQEDEDEWRTAIVELLSAAHTIGGIADLSFEAVKTHYSVGTDHSTESMHCLILTSRTLPSNYPTMPSNGGGRQTPSGQKYRLKYCPSIL